LTKNEQTVTEAYAVDETVHIDPSSPVMPAERISHALKKAMEIGSLCNNASMVRNEDGEFVGQSTDVALLNVLDVFGIPDQRQVCAIFITHRFLPHLLYPGRVSLDYPKGHLTLNKNTWPLVAPTVLEIPPT
jgi:magnesium-transporting ATPase (P-type)